MTAVYFDIPMADEERRQGLYDGVLYVYSPTESTREFARFTRELITEAFGDDDPVQDRMTVEEYAEVLMKLNIRDFMRAKDLAPIPDVVVELFRDGSEESGDLVYKQA